MMEFNENNVSTIASWIWAVIVSPILVSYGISIDQGLGTGIISGIILLGLLVWSAKNPNTIVAFGNGDNPVTENNGVLNDEYVTGDEDDEC